MITKYRVIYTPEAVEDLRGIYYHIAKRLLAPVAARNQVNRIRKGIRGLEVFPSGHAFVEWEPWHGMGIRFLPIDNYSVLYSVDEENVRVIIIRIFYSGRNIETIGHSRS